MKKVAIIQARMGSSRFPGKVLEKLGEKTILQWVVDAVFSVSTIDQVVVATSTLAIDEPIVNWCEQHRVTVFRGSEKDVLERFYKAAVFYKADIVIRITADCPLLDSGLISQIIHLVACGQADYASNVSPPTWPDGLDCEVFTMKALEVANAKALRLSDREHVTPYIRNNQTKFRVSNVTCPIKGLEQYRWTVDRKEDLEYLNNVLACVKKPITTWSILEALISHPNLKQPLEKRNEGFEKSLTEETSECTNFERSNTLLQRALKVIPLGSQTFSKSYIQYPEKVSPLFLTHGSGARVWDVDGNEYIDLVSGLMPIVLGYNDPDVNRAIQEQLNRGISFSLSTELELNLAEMLCEIIPSAQKVRFAKNGTDVTSAAIRLARAYTKRDKVITCGYHGWQDWYIGTTTRNKGIPKAVCALSQSVPYNDLNIVEDLLKSNDYACMILEPCNTVLPKEGYLSGLKSLCEQYGSLLIFDEVITGFRFALGGAQAYFGVTPHLSCFGKAMGNGMPISAIVGQDEFMKEMEEIFFSGTFGGEAPSLAAALATIEKIKDKKVIAHLWEYGQTLVTGLEKVIQAFELNEVLTFNGLAPWKIMGFSDNGVGTAYEFKTLFIQEMLRQGILMNSSLNINYSHQSAEKAKIQNAFEATCSVLSEGIKNKCISSLLKSRPIQPLFKLR